MRTARKKKLFNQDDFTSVLTHQMRYPLTSSRVLLRNILQGSSFKQSAKSVLSRIYADIDRTINFLDTMLLVQKVETEGYDLEYSSLEFDELIEDALQNVNDLVLQKNLNVKFKREKLSLVSDPFILEIVLSNIISNAVKYSKKGGMVEIRASKKDGHFEIKVVDQGVGIPAGEQESVFDRFYRASNVKTLDYEGIGLGLYTVRSFSELLGGEVAIESEKNIGTTVTLKIPDSST